MRRLDLGKTAPAPASCRLPLRILSPRISAPSDAEAIDATQRAAAASRTALQPARGGRARSRSIGSRKPTLLALHAPASTITDYHVLPFHRPRRLRRAMSEDGVLALRGRGTAAVGPGQRRCSSGTILRGRGHAPPGGPERLRRGAWLARRPVLGGRHAVSSQHEIPSVIGMQFEITRPGRNPVRLRLLRRDRQRATDRCGHGRGARRAIYADRNLPGMGDAGPLHAGPGRAPCSTLAPHAPIPRPSSDALLETAALRRSPRHRRSGRRAGATTSRGAAAGPASHRSRPRSNRRPAPGPTAAGPGSSRRPRSSHHGPARRPGWARADVGRLGGDGVGGSPPVSLWSLSSPWWYWCFCRQ